MSTPIISYHYASDDTEVHDTYESLITGAFDYWTDCKGNDTFTLLTDLSNDRTYLFTRWGISEARHSLRYGGWHWSAVEYYPNPYNQKAQ